jgi:hypothetical protein
MRLRRPSGRVAQRRGRDQCGCRCGDSEVRVWTWNFSCPRFPRKTAVWSWADSNRCLSRSRGAAECASPESTVWTHGLGERSALSGVRRFRRPAAPGRKESPAEGARWTLVDYFQTFRSRSPSCSKSRKSPAQNPRTTPSVRHSQAPWQAGRWPEMPHNQRARRTVVSDRGTI